MKTIPRVSAVALYAGHHVSQYLKQRLPGVLSRNLSEIGDAREAMSQSEYLTHSRTYASQARRPTAMYKKICVCRGTPYFHLRTTALPSWQAIARPVSLLPVLTKRAVL